jgi:hypothetical protein
LPEDPGSAATGELYCFRDRQSDVPEEERQRRAFGLQGRKQSSRVPRIRGTVRQRNTGSMFANGVYRLLLSSADGRRKPAQPVPEAALAEIGRVRRDPQELRSHFAFNVHTSSIGTSEIIFNYSFSSIRVFLLFVI